MTIVAGNDSYTQEFHRAADRMHPTVRGTASLALDSYGEMLTPTQAADFGVPRVETRLSIYLSADDLLAGMWEALPLWEMTDPEGLPDDVIRWHILMSLLIIGGPDSTQACAAVDAARRDGGPIFEASRRMIARTFGIEVPTA